MKDQPVSERIAALDDTSKTPERKAYELQADYTMRGLLAARRELLGLIVGAEERGIVLTIDLQSLQPPAMGRTQMIGDVRISRERQRELEELRKAAEKSEEVRDA
jgi:hypothetical protein